ncbi:hypothetical protein [Falsirhodobacter sp. alg1]|uniref:hypothetical protein n=1 Tax=Falsirhodobacter sp. alg1 TaxID=1472418 RepID=UPI0005EE2CB7|nr:hypothetical protein [Falsirhodobacter sp. alg1]
MLEFLTDDLRDGLRAASQRKRRRASRMHVVLDDAAFPVLRLWETGMAVEASRLTHLRGLVDIYDGPHHVGRCLIVASSLEDGELLCEFKTFQTVGDRAPVDFERSGPEISGYLTHA